MEESKARSKKNLVNVSSMICLYILKNETKISVE